jgi:hypothetical protein
MKRIIINEAERRITMKSLKRIVIAVAFIFAISVLLPVTRAADTSSNFPGDDNWATSITFIVPTQIGNLALAPGNYIIQRNPSIYSSRVAMVYNLDRGCWEGIVVGEAARRTGTQQDSVLTKEQQGNSDIEVVRYWFYKGWSDGMEFRASHVNVNQFANKHSKPIATIAKSAK